MSSFSSSGYISSRSTSRAGSLASCEQSSYQIGTTLRSSSSLLSSREDIRGEPAISFPVSRWSSYYSRPERSPLSTVNARQGNEAISFTGAKRDAATSVETNRASFSLGSSTHPSFSCSTELEPKRARLSTVTASSPADLQADTSIERERIGTSNSRIADVSDTNIPATNIIHRDSTDMAARRTARRRITGTARPGTAIGEHRILAIAEGRGIPAEVGLCVIHVNSGECILSQLSDTPSYDKTLHKISVNNPQKILLSATATQDPGLSHLCKLIEHHFPHISIVMVPRHYFNEDMGIRAVKDFGLDEDVATLLLGLSTKYYCLSAIAATFRYIVERDRMVFVNHTVKFSYQGVEGTMLIDIVTAKNLELVSNTSDRHSKDTLFGALDHTVTPMGSRLLRTNILQPSIDLGVIQGRLDAVQRLVSDETLLFSAQMALKPVTDMDHITADIARIPAYHQSPQYAESKINHVIRLKSILKAISTVADLLTPCTDNILLKTIYDILSEPKLDLFSSFINETFHEDVQMEKSSLGIRHQRCYAVKAGVNGLLDVSRQTYKETIEDIYELAARYSESTGLPIKLQFAAGKGFYLTLLSNQFKDGSTLPDIFISVIKKKKQLCFSTIELLQRNSRMDESLTEVYLMSDSAVTDLLKKFQADISVLHKASEAIALLDLLLSFAHASSLSDHVRPEFTSVLAIKDGRHPIMERISKEPVVPNDTFASLSSSFQVITGPNMSGKTTYLKQIALLTIIAQIGAYVPATYASFRLCDQILSRFTNDSCVDMNTSAFQNEMREAEYIIRNMTNSSLILIDELGRATSPYDALGITAAICEKIIQTKACCFFATHLHKLTGILQMYPNVINLQLGVDFIQTATDNSCTLSYSYTVKDGPAASDKHYGLKTAQLVGFPKPILKYAADVVNKLEVQDNEELSTWQNNATRQLQEIQQMNHKKVLLRFADKIMQLQDIPDQVLAMQLQRLQQELSQTN